MLFFAIFIWLAVVVYQACLGYGTAYRLTKMGADNGTALFGWIFVTSLAALVPGLGFYIWNKYKNIDVPEDKFLADADGSSKPATLRNSGGFFSFGNSRKKKKDQNVSKMITCEKCGREYDSFFQACSGCGHRDLNRRNQ